MIKARRYHITLLEVLIAITLTSALLMTLLGYYSYVQHLSRQINKAREEGFQERYAQYRLSQILLKVNKIEHKKDNFFTIDEGNYFVIGQSLVFFYDRGVDIDPLYSGVVPARLFLDRNNRLCLAVWPSPKSLSGEEIPFPKEEVLLGNVQRLKFLFYHPPDVEKKDYVGAEKPVTTGEEKLEPEKGWNETWDKNWSHLPAIVKIIITTESGDKTYVFQLPGSKRFTIVYRA